MFDEKIYARTVERTSRSYTHRCQRQPIDVVCINKVVIKFLRIYLHVLRDICVKEIGRTSKAFSEIKCPMESAVCPGKAIKATCIFSPSRAEMRIQECVSLRPRNDEKHVESNIGHEENFK